MLRDPIIHPFSIDYIKVTVDSKGPSLCMSDYAST